VYAATPNPTATIIKRRPLPPLALGGDNRRWWWRLKAFNGSGNGRTRGGGEATAAKMDLNGGGGGKW
jgi:hypothetical protein